jgi:hypothetical protein
MSKILLGEEEEWINRKERKRRKKSIKEYVAADAMSL